MILTDIAKEDFEKWIEENEYPVSLWALQEGYIWGSIENALVMDFLDSVGIYILIDRNDIDFTFHVDFKGKTIGSIQGFLKRQDVISYAINKVNDFYNSQHFAQCEYCTCDFVTVKRDTKADKGYCSECNKEVKE